MPICFWFYLTFSDRLSIPLSLSSFMKPQVLGVLPTQVLKFHFQPLRLWRLLNFTILRSDVRDLEPRPKVLIASIYPRLNKLKHPVHSEITKNTQGQITTFTKCPVLPCSRHLVLVSKTLSMTTGLVTLRYGFFRNVLVVLTAKGSGNIAKSIGFLKF